MSEAAAAMRATTPGEAPAPSTAPRIRGWRLTVPLAVAALVTGYPVLVHELIASARWPGLTVLAGLLPLLGLVALIVAKAGQRWLALPVLVAGAALGWHWRSALQGNFAWIYLLQHVGMQVFLGWLFARTLLPRKTPLITQLAIRMRGPLAPELLRYTRAATFAWVLFFAFDGAVSLLLFALAPFSLWSLFANVLTWPLVAAMFVGEYVVRRLAHPRIEHVSITAGMRAFWSRPSGDPEAYAAPETAPGSARRPRCPR